MHEKPSVFIAAVSAVRYPASLSELCPGKLFRFLSVRLVSVETHIGIRNLGRVYAQEAHMRTPVYHRIAILNLEKEPIYPLFSMIRISSKTGRENKNEKG